MGSFHALMRRFGSRSTQLVGKLWGDSFPFYYVSEFPRSGGSWLAKMIADYLEIPKPRHTVFPLGFKCVIQNHWSYSSRFKKAYYLYRDGRDVCVSSYFYLMKGLYSSESGSREYFLKKYPEARRLGWSPENCRESLPSFIECWSRRPFGTRTPWADHVEQWAFDRENVVALSYEELVGDCAHTLSRILPLHTGLPIDHERLEATVRKYSFRRQTGRAPGNEAAMCHNRKGIAGDWRNYFSEQSGWLFAERFNETLMKLGYESDRSWPTEQARRQAS